MELKVARKIARLSQRELAEKAGVDKSTLSLLENDKRNYETVAYGQIVRIARALNLEAGELFPVAIASAVSAATAESIDERRSGDERRLA